MSGVKCLQTAHHMVLEQALEARKDQPAPEVARSLQLDEVIHLSTTAAAGPAGGIDAAVLRRLARSLTTPILWLELPAAVAQGGALPPIYGLTPEEKEHVQGLVHDECKAHLKTMSTL